MFLYALVQQLRVVWPIFSGILLAMVGAGLVVGRIEDWRVDEALYFTFVTGLTIGYGDFSPQHLLTRLLAVAIGFAGIVMTGLVAAVAVQALRAADSNLLNKAGQNEPLDQRDP
jgi:divalent metal cation (Fe/Co/Zn/Cd) transporter